MTENKDEAKEHGVVEVVKVKTVGEGLPENEDVVFIIELSGIPIFSFKKWIDAKNRCDLINKALTAYIRERFIPIEKVSEIDYGRTKEIKSLKEEISRLKAENEKLKQDRRKCKKHNIELKTAYSYFPKKKRHFVCGRCINEMIKGV